MARDGSGTYSLPEAAYVNGSTIDATAVNSDLSDIASALTASIAKDGQTVPTANLPMGGFKHTGAADGSARTDYASLGQVAKGTLFYAADTGSADAYAVAPSPGIAANVVGFRVRFKVTNANLTTTPTLAVNSLTAGTIVWPNGSALAAGDLPANAIVECVIASLSGSTPTWHLQTVSVPPVGRSGAETIAGDKTFTGLTDLTAGGVIVATAARGDNTRAAVNTIFLTRAIGGGAIRGYIAGLALSAAGSTATFGIAAGTATDSTNVTMMALASAYTKTTSAWAVGSGNGALDTGAIANSTWYHVYLIMRSDTGVVDVLVSTSASAPTMPTNYDYKRRIGSMKTDGSAQWVAFTQYGDEFWWSAPVLDINDTNPGASMQTKTLASVPTGVLVAAILAVMPTFATTALALYVHALTATDAAASYTAAPLGTGGSTAAAGGITTGVERRVWTNTSAQIGYRTSAATGASDVVAIATYGWIDRRGRDT